jgi:hypothetical protein
VPTELRDMDKASKEDLGYDQAQEGTDLESKIDLQ